MWVVLQDSLLTQRKRDGFCWKKKEKIKMPKQVFSGGAVHVSLLQRKVGIS